LPTDRSLRTLLICVHPRDIGRLLPTVLRSVERNLAMVEDVLLVTPEPRQLLRFLATAPAGRIRPVVLADEDVLSREELLLPGWLRQQIVKLRCHRLVDRRLVPTLGADTVVLQPVDRSDLVDEHGRPVRYYNRYPGRTRHLDYERGRLAAVSHLLGVEPVRSWEPGDFVLDLFVFDTRVLALLEDHLRGRFGTSPFTSIFAGWRDSPASRRTFGEFTLCSVFELDCLRLPVTPKNSASRFLRQLHSDRAYSTFAFDSKVVHFVEKSFPVERIHADLTAHGLGHLVPAPGPAR
jgi:hypothetical protein